MSEIASAFVSLLPSARGFGSKLDGEISGDVTKSGKSAGVTWGKVFGAVAALGVASKVKDFLGESIAEARESQKVNALTAQVIKSTGGAANISAKQMGNLTTAISNKVGVDDEAIQSGANMLLTFKNIRNEAGKGNDIFNQSTQTMVDLASAMAAASGGQINFRSASIQLGKALNDPIKGTTALSKVGVSFTDQQKAQIKTLVTSGKTMQAQKIILKELNSEFGGAAAAQATAGEKAKVAWDNFKEQVGTAILPVLDKVENFLASRLIPSLSAGFSKIGPIFAKIKSAAAPLVSAFKPVADFLAKNPVLVKAFAIALGVLAAAVGVVTIAQIALDAALAASGIPFIIIGIAALVAGLVFAYQHSVQFRTIVQQVAAALVQFGTWIRTQVLPVVVELAKKIGASLKPILTALGQVFRNDIVPAITKVVAKFREWQPTIQKVIGIAIRLEAGLLSLEAKIAGKVLPVVIRFAGFLISRLVPVILNVISVTARIIGAMISFGVTVTRVAIKVVQFVAKVVSTLASLQAKVVGALAGAAKWLFNSGVKIIQGLIDGVKSKAKDVAGAVKGVLSAARNLLPFSPAKTGPFSGKGWTFFSGQSIVTGLADGIRHERARPVRAITDVLAPLSAAIKSKGKAVAAAMAGVLGPLAAAIKTGSTDALGKALGALTAHLTGLPKAAQNGFKALADAGAKSLKPLADSIGKITDKIKALKDESSQIASSVVSAFTPSDLFGGSLSDLISGIGTWQSAIGTATDAFSKLSKLHLDKGFLSALFSSGNTGLISQLAATPSFAAALSQQFAGTTRATAALGNTVGQAATSKQLAESNRQLALLNQKVEHLAAQIGHEVGVEINGVAKNAGHKARVSAATKPRGR